VLGTYSWHGSRKIARLGTKGLAYAYHFVRFIRFVDEKVKAEKEEAKITGKWGYFLRK
jgi:hypothetical protein